MEFALAGRVHLGETLSDALGRERALEFMRTLFRIAARHLLDGRPVSLVEDEVKAELAGYVSSAQEDMLDIAVDHAGYLVELASGIRDSLVRARGSDSAQVLAANAERAKEWESRADELLNAARAAARRADGMSFFAALIESADDVADDLEDAAFNLTLAAGQGQGQMPPALVELAGYLVQGAQEYVMLLETARHIRRGGSREDTQDFVEAFHRIASLEHLCDDAQRVLKRALLGNADRFADIYGVLEAGRKLEHASDHLLRVAITLRDHIFGQVVGRRLIMLKRHHTPVQAIYPIGRNLRGSDVPDPASVGFKAYNLMRMSAIGLPVPHGFVLGTAYCRAFLNHKLARTAQPARRPGPAPGSRHRAGVRRRTQAAVAVGPIRRAGFHAGHAGDGARCRPQ